MESPVYSPSYDAAESPSTAAKRSRRFTPEEDALIKDLVENKKISPWSEVAKYIPGRTGPQCRDRYNSYLYSSTSSKSWTAAEDKIIVDKYKEFGPRWVLISRFLPGRNGNSIKNRWHKALVKYHGISHNSVKQERRNKNDKFGVTSPGSPAPAEKSIEQAPVAELDNVTQSLINDVFSAFEVEVDSCDLFNNDFEMLTYF